MKNVINISNNLYIVNDEPIDVNDWCISLTEGKPIKLISIAKNSEIDEDLKRIILTNDVDLIQDGVQKLSLMFVEGHFNNPKDYYDIEKQYYRTHNGSIQFPMTYEQTLRPDVESCVCYNAIMEKSKENDWIIKYHEDKAKNEPKYSDNDMIKFLSFVGRKYQKTKGHYYMKGDFEKTKKSRISDPRELLKEFNESKNERKQVK